MKNTWYNYHVLPLFSGMFFAQGLAQRKLKTHLPPLRYLFWGGWGGSKPKETPRGLRLAVCGIGEHSVLQPIVAVLIFKRTGKLLK